MSRRRHGLWALALIAAACGESREALPPSAQPEIAEMLRSADEVPADPSDGQGRAWLFAEGSDIPAAASEPGRWEIVFETGPAGIAEGGGIYLQVSPFWGWSTPQVIDPRAPGYTTVELVPGDGGPAGSDIAGTGAGRPGSPGVELEARTLDQQLLGIMVRGSHLAAGRRVRLVYGAGEAGAYADRFAESESRFWIAVDGDGDGRREVIAESPAVRVLPGSAERLVLHLPATARPGETVTLRAAVLDRAGNAGVDWSGTIELEWDELEWDEVKRQGKLGSDADRAHMPARILVGPEEEGRGVAEITAAGEGVVRVTGRTADGLEATSNPLLVGDGPRILWADLHGHSGLSDGTGTAGDYLRYAREVAALEVVALTDHDHWGIEPLAAHRELWRAIGEEVELANEPGRFVALRGFEWTSWIYGHRHVLYFTGEGEVFDSVDRRYERPEQLWQALRTQGQPTLTFAHHSAGGPVATDWRIAPEPELEPVTEIVSVHGSSESADSPFPIYRPVAGNFVRDALDRGYRLGFVGSGDSHDGHPGLAHLASPQMSGLAAIVAEERTREAVLEALRARRTYATNGPRILLLASLDGREPGSPVPASSSSTLEFSIIAVAALSAVEIVRGGRVTDAVGCEGRRECSGTVTLADLEAGDHLYLRALQEDGGAAWSSPFFVE